ncbi:hypothetical protein [Sulfitobacter mediterraneus]|uniref:Uncharacterized protein n=1 Tax=Sulfitobacter mediterraneus TaxID=83219 RepID=A0A2T6CDX7_9RHOB|nr:hypothetical protein [Sulfitobacter mediterraneus]PTX73710.1 hypothetical protein C8N31_106174 [Sulfitobacter mediterraneus]
MTDYSKAFASLLVIAKEYQRSLEKQEKFPRVMKLYLYNWLTSREYINLTDFSISGETRTCYVVDELHANHLVSLSRSDPDAFDICVEICTTNILNAAEMPCPFRLFANKVLNAEWIRPSPRNRPKSEDFIFDLVLFELLTVAITVHGLPMTRNDVSPAHSACDVVSEVLAELDIQISVAQLKDLCVSPKKANRRERMRRYNETFYGSVQFLNA